MTRTFDESTLVLGIETSCDETAAALVLGGSIRVGLEDNFYLPDGTMATSNGELVARARRLTEDLGRRPATVAEARELLGVAPRVGA